MDNGWITETVRVITGLVVGGIAIAVGPRLERKGLAVFAQGVIVTGIAACYLSVYAAFTYYHLVPGPIAYVAMAVLAAIALWRSVAHASLFLAMMSGLVGFSAPMALQTGVMNTGGLFTFLGFIAIMMLGTVVGLRKWYSLFFVALGATIAWWTIWSLGGYGRDQYQLPAAAFSVLADIVLFVGALFAIQSRAPGLLDRIKVSFTVAGLAFLCMYVDSTTQTYELWSKLAVFLVPLVVVCTAWLLVTRNERSQILAHGLGILTIAVACLIPWMCQYDNNAENLTLIAIAVVGSILGKRMQYVGMRITSDIVIGLQLLSILQPENTVDLPSDVVAFANTTMLHFVLVAGYMWFLLDRMQVMRQLAPSVLIYALSLQTFLALQNAMYPWWIHYMVAVAVWTLLHQVVVLITRRRALPYADMYGLAGAAIGVMMWVSMSLAWPSPEDYHSVFNMRLISGLSISAVLLLMWLTIPRPTWKISDAYIIWPGIMLITFVLTTMETITPQWKTIIEVGGSYGWGSMVARDLIDRMQLLLSCAWIAYAAVVVAIGFVKRIKVARLAGMGVLGVAVLKVFLYDLSNLQTPFRIISFIVLGLILFGASYLYARFKDRIIA